MMDIKDLITIGSSIITAIATGVMAITSYMMWRSSTDSNKLSKEIHDLTFNAEMRKKELIDLTKEKIIDICDYAINNDGDDEYIMLKKHGEYYVNLADILIEKASIQNDLNEFSNNLKKGLYDELIYNVVIGNVK